MKKALLFLQRCFLAAIIFCPGTVHAQLITYTNDTGGVLSAVAPGITGTALTRVNGTLRASSPCAHGFTSRNLDAATTFSDTMSAVQVTAYPTSGTMNVTGFSAGIRRSSTGPVSARLAYSTNGGLTWTDQGFNQSPNNASCDSVYNATWATSFAVTSPAQLVFRVYAFGASGSTGNLQILNLIINGTDSASAPACTIPAGITTGSITATSATVSWLASAGALSYMVGYRVSGTTTWTDVPTAGTSLVLTGLTPGTTYQYDVRSICAAGDSSAWSSTATFTTSLPPCTAPASLSAGSITSSSATISWATVTGAINYEIGYKPSGSTTWTNAYTTATSMALTGLMPVTTYNYEVRAICAAGDTSAWSAISSFTTILPPCSVPTSVTAASVTPTSETVSWTAVSGALSYVVGYRLTGTTTWTDVPAAGTSLTLTGLTSGTAYQYDVRAVCYAGDSSAWSSTYTFTTGVPPCATPTGITATGITATSANISWAPVAGAAGYILGYKTVSAITWTNVTVTGTSITITGLMPGVTYDYDVRTVCAPGDNSPRSAISTFTTVLPPCAVPAGITVSGITSSSASVSWGAVAGAMGYIVGHREAGSSTWYNTYTTATLLTLSGLYSGMPYQYDVRTICMAGDSSAWSATGTFTTTGTTYCAVPAGLTSSTLASSVVLSWDAVPAATGYIAGYRLMGSSAWTDVYTPTNSVTLTGLSLTLAYQYDVRSICGVGDSSGWSSYATFRHAATGISEVTARNNVAIHPNPSQDRFTISYHLDESREVTIIITNTLGQTVAHITDNELQPAGDHNYTFEPLKPGLYIVSIRIDDEVYTEKAMKL